MQLAVVLIREVWLCELRTYGFSKDIEWFRVGRGWGVGELEDASECEEAKATMGNEEWVNAYSMESDSSCRSYLLCGYFVI